MPMIEMSVYTPEEVAKTLRISEETVRREIRANHLGAQRIGKQYRIAPSDLVAYLGEVRFIELFAWRNEFRNLIGSGGLSEAQAIKLAQQAVQEARANAPMPSAGLPQPSLEEVRLKLRKK
jgi:excisionase family DNA binding protein